MLLVSDSGANLDPVEFECICQLVLAMCEFANSPSRGLSVSTFERHPYMRALQRWSACYYDGVRLGFKDVLLTPLCLIERMMVRSFDTIPSIADSFNCRL